MSKYKTRTFYYLEDEECVRCSDFWFDNYTAGEGIKDLFDIGYLVDKSINLYGDKQFKTQYNNWVVLIEETIYKLA